MPVDSIDAQKRTPLIWAAREGHDATCAYLLSKGARVQNVDADNLNAIQHATERHQRQAVVVLTHNIHEVASRRRLGTFGLILADRAALGSALFGIAYVLCVFAAMLFLPSILTHVAFGLYFGKNLVFATFYRVPPNHRSQTSGDDFSQVTAATGIPRNYADSVRSLDHVLRLREPANLFCLLTFLAVQHVSMLSANLDISSVYWALLGGTLLSAYLTKHFALHSIAPPSVIQDSAVVRAVRERRFKQLHARLVDQEKHIRVPLRAFYCYEVDEIIRQFDSFSSLLDVPIGESNYHFWAYFVLLFTLLQLHVFVYSWETLSARLCDAANPTSGPLYAFVFHALPCVVKSPSDSWSNFLMPSSLNSAGISHRPHDGRGDGLHLPRQPMHLRRGWRLHESCHVDDRAVWSALERAVGRSHPSNVVIV
jgi:hypothetical protein